MRIFPTGALLMPAAVLLSGAVKKPPRGKEILNWMIWASLTRRYSGSAQEKLDLDIASCFSDSPIRALKRNIQKTSSRSKITANERNFDSSLNDRYAMFLTYVACYFSSMRDLFDGRRVSSSSSQWHHVIPRGSLKPKFRRALDNASNVAFILGATNRKISCIDASEYLQKISPRILQSQCIPLDRTVWKDSKDFMRARARLLTKAIAQFLDDDNSIHAFDPVNSNGK